MVAQCVPPKHEWTGHDVPQSYSSQHGPTSTATPQQHSNAKLGVLTTISAKMIAVAGARVAGIHGDVLSVHTEVFSVPHHTAHTQHNTHRHTQHNTESHTTSHGERGKERQKKKKEKEERERRQRKRERRRRKRRDKTREEIKRADKRQDEKEERRIFCFFKKMFENSQIRQMNKRNMFRKKMFSDGLFLHFFLESSESDRFPIIYMIRIRFFGPVELNQKGFSTAQYSTRIAPELLRMGA